MLMTEAEVREERRVGIHAVAGGVPGFSWRITRASRSWVLRAMLKGKRCELGMGGADVSYRKALAAAAAARRLIGRGIDPREWVRDAEQAHRRWDWDRYRPRCGDDDYSLLLLLAYSQGRELPKILQEHVFPALGRYPMRRLSPEDIAGCLFRIAERQAAEEVTAMLRSSWRRLNAEVELPAAEEFFQQVKSHLAEMQLREVGVPVTRAPAVPNSFFATR